MNDFEDLGQQIQNMVQRAVNSRDFEELSRNIADTADIALREIGRGLDRASDALHGRRGNDTWDEAGRSARKEESGDSTGRSAWTSQRYEYSSRQTQSRTRYEYSYSSRQTEERSGYRSGEFQRKQGNTALFNPSRGRIAAPLCLTLGCLGTAGFGLCLLLMVALWLSDLGMLLLLWLALLFFLPLTAVSAAVLLHGRSVRDRNRRARLYWNLLGGRTYISLRELASGSGRNIEYIRRDLQEMIHRGYFPQARLDANRDTLILDLETYRLYLAAQEQAAHRDEQEKGEKQTAGAQEEPQKTETPELSPEVREVLAEGARVVTLIREANDDLPEKEISDKLDRLEAIVKRIFEILTTEPDKLPDIRRFIQYYLPTTCKLVQVYRDLDRESIQTENMVKSKAQILDTLDTINQAFEKLLDGLYADTAMDVASDISVLETLLAQEGLTK